MSETGAPDSAPSVGPSPREKDLMEVERVFVEYGPAVYRFLYSRVGNREDAEELTSEVFMRTTQRLDPNRDEQSITAWIFTVARTVLADHWRRYYRAGALLPFDDAHWEPDPQMDSEEADAETVQAAQAILATLPPRYRQVLELRFLRGYSVKETARALDITVDNAKVLQHRALAKAAQLGSEVIESRGRKPIELSAVRKLECPCS